MSQDLKNYATLAVLAILVLRPAPSAALSPSLEWVCCNRSEPRGKECTQFTLTPERCTEVLRGFAEAHGLWLRSRELAERQRREADEKKKTLQEELTRERHLIDSGGASIQSGTGLSWERGTPTK